VSDTFLRPRPGGLPEGFCEVVHPDMPDSPPGVVPVTTLEHWMERGFVLSDNPHNPPLPAPAEDPAPSGADPITTPEGA
jgi:hypothetical protein